MYSWHPSQAEARKEMNGLLGMKMDDDITSAAWDHMPSEKDLEDFADGLRDPPELEPLEISWDEPTGLWNQELAVKFQERLISKFPEFEGRETEVQDFFIQRVQTLQKRLNMALPKKGETLEAAQARMGGKLEKERVAKKKRARRFKVCD